MRLRRRWPRKLLRSIQHLRLQSRRKLQLISGIAGVCLLVWLAGHWLASPEEPPFGHSESSCSPIDAVYTWVNGSDPNFIESILRFEPNYDPSRFDDKNELLYSLRSLEKHAHWIRHVYIVTNGQIPNWLDLSYERVTVVPHEVLAPDPRQLPTFSSPAIETFLHRIPKLSKRFLYLNDDVFLGAPLYPEDLYTEAEGVRVYQDRMVPDCTHDCSWTYVGDGACDMQCNIEDCQFDGGDCSKTKPTDSSQLLPQSHEMHEVEPSRQVHGFPHTAQEQAFKSSANFKDVMRHRNVSTLDELERIVERFNREKLMSSDTDAEAIIASEPPTSVRSVLHKKDSTDVYKHSLIATNKLLNLAYGFKARHGMAHVAFLIDREIVEAMEQRFRKQIRETAFQRFRAPTDLQYAFTYYTFLMSEKRVLGVGEIFDEFDTDGSGTWSDREVRTFLTRIYPPPLDWSAMRYFEEVIQNCTRSLGLDTKVETVEHSTLVYERYEDSNLPTITRDLVVRCSLLAEALAANFSVRRKYRYHLNPKRTPNSNFVMLTSNLTEVVESLDSMRRNPRKFNCINDNMSATRGEDNELVRTLLEDFYLSFFPRRSKFELPPQFRNRYASWRDYQRWRRRKRAVLVVGYGVSLILVVCLLKFMCQHKAKFVRRCVQRL
ncbi:hypothetical protein KR018_010176 [Drosophila ironensis]|nr:hypothetical protein KR018_010176 [Drosophila ironensis]